MAEKRGKFSALAELHRQLPEPETPGRVEEQAPSPLAVTPESRKSREPRVNFREGEGGDK